MKNSQVVETLKLILESNGIDTEGMEMGSRVWMYEDGLKQTICDDIEDEFDVILSESFFDFKADHWKTLGSLASQVREEIEG